MKQWLVSQHPRRKNRRIMSSGYVIVTAATRAAAIRKAAEQRPEFVSATSTSDFAPPHAEEIREGMAFYA
jgi:hypothetical protein